MSRFATLTDAIARKPKMDTPDDEDPEILDPDEQDEDETKSNKKDKPMTEATLAAAEKTGFDAGFKAAMDRMNTVIASEHYAGREALASKMLGKANMTAADITDVLAASPKIEPSALLTEAQQKAAEDAGRAEMLAALATSKNSDIAPDAPNANESAQIAAGWSASMKAANELAGL